MWPLFFPCKEICPKSFSFFLREALKLGEGAEIKLYTWVVYKCELICRTLDCEDHAAKKPCLASDMRGVSTQRKVVLCYCDSKQEHQLVLLCYCDSKHGQPQQGIVPLTAPFNL